MIVADASVVIDLLAGPGSPAADRLAEILSSGEPVAVPHLLDAEIGQVIRRWAAAGRLSADLVGEILGVFLDLPLDRVDHGPFMLAAMALRHNVTFYDAIYLAMAEGLDVPLLTADGGMGNVPGSRAQVEVVPARP